MTIERHLHGRAHLDPAVGARGFSNNERTSWTDLQTIRRDRIDRRNASMLTSQTLKKSWENRRGKMKGRGRIRTDE
jgi:hypothetical protein